MELALRRNRGGRLIADWSRLLSEAVGVEISTNSFLPIEHTEELKRAFFIKVVDVRERKTRKELRVNWEKRDIYNLVSRLNDLCIAVGPLPVVLFSSVDQFIGAIRLPADCILRNVISVWKVVEEDLCVTTEDLQHGLCLEENYYTRLGDYKKEGVYELTLWGMFAEGKADHGR
jgi:hypothetical protein